MSGLLHFEVVPNFHKLRAPYKISHFYLFWKIINTDQTGPAWQLAEAEKQLATLEDLPALQFPSTSITPCCYTPAPVPSFTSPCCILLGMWICDFQAGLKALWWQRLYLSQHRVQKMQALIIIAKWQKLYLSFPCMLTKKRHLTGSIKSVIWRGDSWREDTLKNIELEKHNQTKVI